MQPQLAPQHPEFLAHLAQIGASLAQLPSLAPAPATNHLFQQLVGLATAPASTRQAEKLLKNLPSDTPLPAFQAIAGRGEYALELFWARKAAASKTPLKVMEEFPYWSNYQKLVALEAKLLKPVLPAGSRVLFVGSGPLPLTSYLLAQTLGVHITNADLDAEAHLCASTWLKATPMGPQLACLHADIRHVHNFAPYQAVILAAMVGLTPKDRTSVMQHLAAHMHPGQILLARSARGLRQLLYRPLTPADLTGFRVLKTLHPRNEVVNSVILAYRQHAPKAQPQTPTPGGSSTPGCPCCGA